MVTREIVPDYAELHGANAKTARHTDDNDDNYETSGPNAQVPLKGDQSGEHSWATTGATALAPGPRSTGSSANPELERAAMGQAGRGRSETNPFKRKPVAAPSESNGREIGTNPWRPEPNEIGSAHASEEVKIDGHTSVPEVADQTGNPSESSLVALIPGLGDEEEDEQDSHMGRIGRDKGKAPLTASVIFGKLGGSGDPGESQNGSSVPIHGKSPKRLSRQSTWEDFSDEEKERKEMKIPKGTGTIPRIENAPDVTVAQPDTGVQAPSTLPSQDPLSQSSADLSLPKSADTQQPNANSKTETYQIKNINWFDHSSPQNPRKTPILVQNLNGPCPLVALVNALTLTTPAQHSNTVLVESLRSREQISLDLLLQIVFDELMSSRRTADDTALPDITELYAFLQSLHQGMYCNPRYIPTEETAKAIKRTSLSHVHPIARGDLIPGTFEKTRDMELYATFKILLTHGWLPAKDDPVYPAFERQASSYEDVQNLLCREEELEDKLTSDGLTEQEQQVYQDLTLIKNYLETTATQLTPWGLEVISKSMQPGQFAILFRNDHFSTLYSHPETSELLTLVTDAGYRNHEEVIWESLNDVKGERTEFLSGDFRIVGGPEQRVEEDSTERVWDDGAGGSSTVGAHQNPRRSSRPSISSSHVAESSKREIPSSDQPLSSAEQEDHDLALALQLQEEEEQRHEKEIARNRERRRSEQQGDAQRRRSSSNNNNNRNNNNNNSNRRFNRHPSAPNASQTSLTPSRGSGRGNILVPVRGSSVAQSGPSGITVTSGRGRGRFTEPTTQHVSPLVPPAPATTHRPVDSNEDDAPPSYEQASKQGPYHPPAGHPSHHESAPAPTGRRRQAAANAMARIQGRASGVSLREGNNGVAIGHPHPQHQQPQAQPTNGSGPGGRERGECVTM